MDAPILPCRWKYFLGYSAGSGRAEDHREEIHANQRSTVLYSVVLLEECDRSESELHEDPRSLGQAISACEYEDNYNCEDGSGCVDMDNANLTVTDEEEGWLESSVVR